MDGQQVIDKVTLIDEKGNLLYRSGRYVSL